MKIYTKTGDGGMTSLFGGRRVAKDNLRVEAYGSVDELNSLLGVALSVGLHDEVASVVGGLQETLFVLGADLATPEEKNEQIRRIGDSDVEALESFIDSAERTLPPLRSFVLPGGSPAAAALHHARTVCRRAERTSVRLSLSEAINPSILRFLNRLSDLLFVLARQSNILSGLAEVQWKGK